MSIKTYLAHTNATNETNETKGIVVIPDIKKSTLINDKFREILYTGTVQIVNMSLKPNEEIPKESHDTDQVFVFLGDAEVITHTVDGNGTDEVTKLKWNDCLVVPANTEHTIKNTSDDVLKLYSIYGKPQH